MMKKFLANPDTGVGILASANLAFAGVDKLFQWLQPFFSVLLSAAQVGVALVTIYYIWRKAKAIKIPSFTRKKKK